MDVSVTELRNHTRRVIAAVESGEAVVLTVHGRPIADIIPRRSRSERRPSDVLLADLAAIAALADDLGVESDPREFDTGLTTDDMTLTCAATCRRERAAAVRSSRWRTTNVVGRKTQELHRCGVLRSSAKLAARGIKCRPHRARGLRGRRRCQHLECKGRKHARQNSSARLSSRDR